MREYSTGFEGVVRTLMRRHDETDSDQMKQYGGFIPGIRAGSATSRYLSYVMNRLTTRPQIPSDLAYRIVSIRDTDTYDRYLEPDQQTLGFRPPLPDGFLISLVGV